MLVNKDWLMNQRLRAKFRKEWDYLHEEVPIVPGSKITLTYITALGPKFDLDNTMHAQSNGDSDDASAVLRERGGGAA